MRLGMAPKSDAKESRIANAKQTNYGELFFVVARLITESFLCFPLRRRRDARVGQSAVRVPEPVRAEKTPIRQEDALDSFPFHLQFSNAIGTEPAGG